MDKKRKRWLTGSYIIDSRRGQVTIFIILGILLVLALLVVVFIKKEIVTVKPEELITTGKGPVADYIATCIQKLGEEALMKLGEQGGYVTLPQEIARNGYVHLKTSPFTAVPYWAYGTTRAVPSLSAMEAQVDAYLQLHLRKCVFESGAFTQSYNLVERSELKADTEIVDAKVIFNVNWKIEVQDKQGEKITELVEHTAQSPVKLKRLYDTGVKIVDDELRDLKLEDITQDLIALEHPSIPLFGFEMSCSPKQWKIEDVKRALQDLLRVNIRQLKVKGTDIIDFPEELPYYQNHYVWDVGDDLQQKNVAVDFYYDNSYPFTFDVHPRSGSTLKSAPLAAGSNPLLSAFCGQSWKFTYDISYPILITLTDETTGYTLKVALTAHLKRNIPNREETSIPAVPPARETYSDQQFCDTRKIPMTISTAELIDNDKDVSYSAPLEKVNISYNCLQYQCALGQTEYDYALLGDVAVRAVNVPYCANAIFRGQKAGYKDGWINLATKAGARAEIKLIPALSFPAGNITVVKHNLLGENNEEQLFGAEIPLSKEETVIIKLTSVQKDAQTNLPLAEATAVLSAELPSDVLKNQPFELLAKADFDYLVEVTVLAGEKFVGGYKGKWKVPWEDLEIAEKLTFHVVSTEKSGDTELFALFAGLEEKSARLPLPELEIR